MEDDTGPLCHGILQHSRIFHTLRGIQDLDPDDIAILASRNISSAGISLARPSRKSLSLRSASTTHKCRFSLSEGTSKLKMSLSASRALASRSSFMISASSCSTFIACHILLIIVAGQHNTVLHEGRLQACPFRFAQYLRRMRSA